MKRLLFVLACASFLFPACKQSEVIGPSEFTLINSPSGFHEPPQFSYFGATTNGDNTTLHMGTYSVHKGVWVSINYMIDRVRTLEFYYNDQKFMSSLVDNPHIYASYMWQCESSVVFKMRALNNVGNMTETINIVVVD